MISPRPGRLARRYWPPGASFDGSTWRGGEGWARTAWPGGGMCAARPPRHPALGGAARADRMRAPRARRHAPPCLRKPRGAGCPTARGSGGARAWAGAVITLTAVRRLLLQCVNRRRPEAFLTKIWQETSCTKILCES